MTAVRDNLAPRHVGLPLLVIVPVLIGTISGAVPG